MPCFNWLALVTLVNEILNNLFGGPHSDGDAIASTSLLCI